MDPIMTGKIPILACNLASLRMCSTNSWEAFSKRFRHVGVILRSMRAGFVLPRKISAESQAIRAEFIAMA